MKFTALVLFLVYHHIMTGVDDTEVSPYLCSFASRKVKAQTFFCGFPLEVPFLPHRA